MRTSDLSFRPIDVRLGPDGALYVADWSEPGDQPRRSRFPRPAPRPTHGPHLADHEEGRAGGEVGAAGWEEDCGAAGEACQQKCVGTAGGAGASGRKPTCRETSHAGGERARRIQRDPRAVHRSSGRTEHKSACSGRGESKSSRAGRSHARPGPRPDRRERCASPRSCAQVSQGRSALRLRRVAFHQRPRQAVDRRHRQRCLEGRHRRARETARMGPQGHRSGARGSHALASGDGRKSPARRQRALDRAHRSGRRRGHATAALGWFAGQLCRGLL